jgi:hypothetical protein
VSAQKIPFMPLPLFLVVRLTAPFIKKRFGFFGARVMPGLLFEGGHVTALTMGAVLGRARPDLIESVIQSYSDRPNHRERVRSQRELLAQMAESLLATQGDPETFHDFLEFDASIGNRGAWIDVRDALPTYVQWVLVGLELGARKPALTRSLVENEVRDRSGRRKALLQAGLKHAEHAFKSYDEWERYVLSEVDEWQRKWGAKVDDWQRTLG